MDLFNITVIIKRLYYSLYLLMHIDVLIAFVVCSLALLSDPQEDKTKTSKVTERNFLFIMVSIFIFSHLIQ